MRTIKLNIQDNIYNHIMFFLKSLNAKDIEIINDKSTPLDTKKKKELKLSIKGNVDLPRYLASSNSNQLTTLYLYFRHWISQKTDHYMLEFFEMLVVLQLLSIEIAVRLENDVDMPRNLAKSVTVA
ncbi:MAG TPA: hypothetical protein EYG73_08615 [Arcobacter sp.]|nr:hypothetical protein [Arcobacter sp.]